MIILCCPEDPSPMVVFFCSTCMGVAARGRVKIGGLGAPILSQSVAQLVCKPSRFFEKRQILVLPSMKVNAPNQYHQGHIVLNEGEGASEEVQVECQCLLGPQAVIRQEALKRIQKIFGRHCAMANRSTDGYTYRAKQNPGRRICSKGLYRNHYLDTFSDDKNISAWRDKRNAGAHGVVRRFRTKNPPTYKRQ